MGLKGHSFEAVMFDIEKLLVFDIDLYLKDESVGDTWMLRPEVSQWLKDQNVEYSLDIRYFVTGASTITIMDERVATLFKLTWL